MACFCDKEYEALIIEGNPTPDELINTWEAIYMEYSELMQDTQYSIIKDTVKEINLLNAKIRFAAEVVVYLNDYYSPDLVNMLKVLRIDVKLNPDDEVQYYRGIKSIVSKAKKWDMDLKELHIELARMQETQVQGGTNYDFFYDALNALSKFQGYGIKPSDIKVAQFCKLYQQLKMTNELKQLRNGD